MKVFTELKTEFPKNWMEDYEVFGTNPRAFETQHPFKGTVDTETEVGRLIRSLFENSPNAKVKKVSISFSPNFAEDDFGGTITISGTF